MFDLVCVDVLFFETISKLRIDTISVLVHKQPVVVCSPCGVRLLWALRDELFTGRVGQVESTAGHGIECWSAVTPQLSRHITLFSFVFYNAGTHCNTELVSF